MYSNEERTWGMLSHLITLVVNYMTGGLGWIVGLIIYAVKGRESKFVAFHALQSALFQLAMAALAWLCVCTVLFFWLALVPAIMGIVFPIIGLIKANSGEEWEYPIVGKFAKRSAGL